jgi:hypothetical protein
MELLRLEGDSKVINLINRKETQALINDRVSYFSEGARLQRWYFTPISQRAYYQWFFFECFAVKKDF